MDLVLDILGRYGLYGLAAVGVGLSFMASAIETGTYRLNRVRLKLRADAGDRRAASLLGLLQDLSGLVITILVANNAANFIVTAAVTTLLAEAASARSDLFVQLLATAIVTPGLFVFCELLPKNVFAFAPEDRMCRLAGAVRAAYVALFAVGLVPALKGISNLILRIARKQAAEGSDPFHPRQRLRAVLSESAAEGVISGYQHELVGRVLGLRERLVRDVMIPMGRVASVPIDISRGQFVEQLRRHSYSRLPVWEGRKDHVVGIVHINDVLGEQSEALALGAVMAREFVAVPPDMTVGQAMFRLRKGHAAMAVVRDSKDRAVGIITIKDLVEEIVGELAAW